MALPPRKSAAPKDAPKAPKAKADWDAIERDYRTGRFTLRELEAKHGAVYSTIARRADRHGWTKDLSEAIRQATNTKLVQQAVSETLSQQDLQQNLQREIVGAQQAATETVLVAAEINKNIILGHRKGLNRLRAVKEKLITQIEAIVDTFPDLQEVIEMVRSPDERGMDKANDALRKAMERSTVVDDLKKLAEIDERVRKGEREAFSISDEPPKTPEDRINAMLDSISARGSRLPVSGDAE